MYAKALRGEFFHWHKSLCWFGGRTWHILSDFWEFDPGTNSWQQKANFGGGSRNISSGFSIGSKGYIGMGLFTISYQDFWEYDSLSMAIFSNISLCWNTVNFNTNITGVDSCLWNFGDGTTSTLANPSKSFDSPGTYNVMLIVFWSCSSDTVYLSVTIYSPLITSKNISICNGDSIFLQGDFQTSGGTYYDSLETINGCDSITSTELGFIGQEFKGYDTTIGNGETIQLTISGGNSYYWNTGESTQNIDVNPLKNSTYIVTITDADGCKDTATINITVNDQMYSISISNIFSPNQDGINDIIKVHGYGVKEYKLVIYDRVGEKIFENRGSLLTVGQDEGIFWDGKFKGQPLNQAVFVYTLEAVFVDETEFREKGNIALIK